MGVFNWQDEVYNLLYETAKRLGLPKHKASYLAAFALKVAGPGEGHGRVGYRVRQGTKPLGRRTLTGWWVVELGGKDSHDEAQPRSTFVTDAAVNKLWRVIKSVAPRNPTLTRTTEADSAPQDYSFRVKDVAKGMIRKGVLPKRFDYRTFSGGDHRAGHYFPKYLYPMRVLDHEGFIRFGMTSWRLK